MAESAKLLSSEKTIWMPDTAADCPMAHMVSAEKIKERKAITWCSKGLCVIAFFMGK